MAYTIGVSYFNSFWLKKVLKASATSPNWPGLPWYGASNNAGYPAYPFGTSSTVAGTYENNNYQNFYVEESRIKGGFNNSQIT